MSSGFTTEAQCEIERLLTMENLPPALPELLTSNEPTPTWEELGLSNEALTLIQKAGFKIPSPVQSKSIPIALTGSDLIASAQTGTGKTASFVLPMVDRFAGTEGTFGLILSPTREIAQQTQATLDLFGKPRGIRSIVLIGGIDMKIDAAALKTYPQVIVATPGRLCDHLDRGNIWLDFIKIVVLDEADRMLDMGFADQLARIMQDVPKDRQTLLFSATISPSVDKLARKIMHDPKQVSVGKPLSAAASVEQRVLWMSEEAKPRELLRLIQNEKGSIIVFTRSKDGATRVWRSLHARGIYEATYIHSDKIQAHREQALAEFKEGKYRILIATDVAARGIHVENVAHVVNFDLPHEPEDYVHRIGRTGRKDASGISTTFVTRRDQPLLGRIEKLLKHKIPEEFAPSFNEAPQESRGESSRTRSPRGGGRHKNTGTDSGASPSKGKSAPPKQQPSQNPSGLILPKPLGAKSSDPEKS